MRHLLLAFLVLASGCAARPSVPGALAGVVAVDLEVVPPVSPPEPPEPVASSPVPQAATEPACASISMYLRYHIYPEPAELDAAAGEFDRGDRAYDRGDRTRAAGHYMAAASLFLAAAETDPELADELRSLADNLPGRCGD